MFGNHPFFDPGSVIWTSKMTILEVKMAFLAILGVLGMFGNDPFFDLGSVIWTSKMTILEVKMAILAILGFWPLDFFRRQRASW